MFRKTLYYLDKGLTFFEEWTLFVTVSVALITLFVSVCTRYLITYTLTWPEELVREVIIYTTFIGCASAVKAGGLIRIDALPNLFPRLKRTLDYLSHGAVLVFSVFVTYFGWKLVQLQFVTQQATVILKIPQYVLFSILPLMGILMFCRLVHVITEDITGEPIQK